MAGEGSSLTSVPSGLDALLLQRGAPIAITVPKPSRLPHVRGRGTADEPRESPERARKPGGYSAHSCVGDLSTVKPRAQRACLFERVCLDTTNSEFLYYRDAATTQAPILFDRRYGHLFSFGRGELLRIIAGVAAAGVAA